MFDESIIVQSAVSAFNNAALSAPAFLWWGILSVPLFFMVYYCGKYFLEKIGWVDKSDLISRFSFIVVFMTLVWLILFGGNYGVLRDNVTVLPFLIAAISFVASLFIGSHSRKMKFSDFKNLTRAKKTGIIIFILSALFLIAISDLHSWWGPILQIGAIITGLIFGRLSRCEMRSIPGTLLVIISTTVAILMQPEFFRFGQLGGLTIFHSLAIFLVGATVVATVALRNIPSKGLKTSVYIKLKWLLRFISVLCLALFILTESIPIFLGGILVLFFMFALSICHLKEKNSLLADKMFAITLVAFGTLTVMPVITSIGILLWVSLPKSNFWKQIKFLL